LKAEFEKLKTEDEVWEIDEEDEEALAMELVKQLQGGETEFDVNEFQNMAAKTLGAFLEGEKYDFTRDLTDAYKSSM
jgi:hypothetical protein